MESRIREGEWAIDGISSLRFKCILARWCGGATMERRKNIRIITIFFVGALRNSTDCISTELDWTGLDWTGRHLLSSSVICIWITRTYSSYVSVSLNNTHLPNHKNYSHNSLVLLFMNLKWASSECSCEGFLSFSCFVIVLVRQWSI